MLHVEPVNLVLLKTYNAQSNIIIITFKDQNGTPLELQEKVNLTSLTNLYNHLFRTRMNEFLSFARNLSKKYGKKFCYRKRITCCKNYFQIKFHKTAEATGKKSLKILWKQRLFLMSIEEMLKGSYSTRRKTRNIARIKTSIIK